MKDYLRKPPGNLAIVLYTRGLAKEPAWSSQ